MKKALTLICMAVLFSLKLFSQCNWTAVGPDDYDLSSFNMFSSSFYDVKISPTNIPYIVFYDGYLGNLNVRKFTGQKWEYVGAPNFETGYGSKPDIEFDAAGVPYIAFLKSNGGSGSGIPTVMSFNGSAWNSISTQVIPNTGSHYISLAFNTSNQPYVVFDDVQSGNKLKAYFFNGTVWNLAGNASFTSTITLNPDLQFDIAGIPYVACTEYTFPETVKIYKLNGASWSQVGGNLTAIQSAIPKLRFNSLNEPYVTYKSSTTGNKLAIRKYDGSTWAAVGNEISDVSNFGFDIDAQDSLIVSYADLFWGSKASIKKFDGANWNYFLTPGYSIGSISNTIICYNNLNDLYIAQSDGSRSDVLVGKLVGSSWNYLGSNLGIANNFDLFINPIITSDKNGIAYVGATAAIGIYNIYKFDGSTWSLISTPNLTNGNTYGISMNCDSLGNLYVAFPDPVNFDHITVKKFDGTNWSIVGNAGFSIYPSTATNIEIAPNGHPVVSNQSTVELSTWDGSSWQNTMLGIISNHRMTLDEFGNPYFFYLDWPGEFVIRVKGNSIDTIGNLSNIFFQPHGIDVYHETPYIVYLDNTLGYKASVKKFDGTSWVQVGNPGMSGVGVLSAKIQIDGAGNPFVYAKDSVYGFIIKKFDGTNWVDIASSVIPFNINGNHGDLNAGVDGKIRVVYGISRAYADVLTPSSLNLTGTITGDTIVCAQSQQTYSINPVGGATTYNWSLPFGWTGSSTSNSILVTPGQQAGNIIVNANSLCSNSLAQTIHVNTVASSLQQIADTVCKEYTFNGITYLQSGFYTQNFLNIAGCDSILELNLVIKTVDTSVTQSSAVLTANQQGASYQWCKCPGFTPIAGETNSSYTPAANGDFAVIILKDGCSDTSSCQTVVLNSLVENEISQFEIYPNPVQNEMIVSSFANKVSEYRILQLSGKIIAHGILNSNAQTVINTSKYIHGFYIIQVLTKQGWSSKSFVK